MRTVTDDFETAIEEDTIYPFILADIETSSETLHVWGGYGSLTWNDTEYLGLANLGSISNVEEVQTLYASGATLNLLGVPSSLVSVALQELEQGNTCTIYLGLFDADTGEVISDPSEIFEGLIDVPTITDAGESSTISVTVETELIRLESALNSSYTPHDQKRDYPSDEGFDFVAGLVEKEIDFGS